MSRLAVYMVLFGIAIFCYDDTIFASQSPYPTTTSRLRAAWQRATGTAAGLWQGSKDYGRSLLKSDDFVGNVLGTGVVAAMGLYLKSKGFFQGADSISTSARAAASALTSLTKKESINREMVIFLGLAGTGVAAVLLHNWFKNILATGQQPTPAGAIGTVLDIASQGTIEYFGSKTDEFEMIKYLNLSIESFKLSGDDTENVSINLFFSKKDKESNTMHPYILRLTKDTTAPIANYKATFINGDTQRSLLADTAINSTQEVDKAVSDIIKALRNSSDVGG